jgi:hypothetical protein
MNLSNVCVSIYHSMYLSLYVSMYLSLYVSMYLSLYVSIGRDHLGYLWKHIVDKGIYLSIYLIIFN